MDEEWRSDAQQRNRERAEVQDYQLSGKKKQLMRFNRATACMQRI